MNSIRERDIISIKNRYADTVILSTRIKFEEAQNDYRSRVVTSNILNKTHIFVWIPSNGSEGSAQVIDRNGRNIGNAVRIIRGL